MFSSVHEECFDYSEGKADDSYLTNTTQIAVGESVASEKVSTHTRRECKCKVSINLDMANGSFVLIVLI